MGEYTCQFCRFQYDERNGDKKNGIPQGTSFLKLSGTLCSRCGMQGERHKRKSFQEYRGLEAKYFDLFAGKSGINFYKRWLNKFPAASILELGVGTGRIGLELAEKNNVFTGVDISEEMLAIAERKKLD